MLCFGSQLYFKYFEQKHVSTQIQLIQHSQYNHLG